MSGCRVCKIQPKKPLTITTKYYIDSFPDNVRMALVWYKMQDYMSLRNPQCFTVFVPTETRRVIKLAPLMCFCFQQRLASEAERLQREHLWQDGIKVKLHLSVFPFIIKLRQFTFFPAYFCQCSVHLLTGAILIQKFLVKRFL